MQHWRCHRIAAMSVTMRLADWVGSWPDCVTQSLTDEQVISGHLTAG